VFQYICNTAEIDHQIFHVNAIVGLLSLCVGISTHGAVTLEMIQLSIGADEPLEFTSSPSVAIPDGMPENPAKDQRVIDHTGRISVLNVYLDISHHFCVSSGQAENTASDMTRATQVVAVDLHEVVGTKDSSIIQFRGHWITQVPITTVGTNDCFCGP